MIIYSEYGTNRKTIEQWADRLKLSFDDCSRLYLTIPHFGYLEKFLKEIRKIIDSEFFDIEELIKKVLKSDVYYEEIKDNLYGGYA